MDSTNIYDVDDLTELLLTALKSKSHPDIFNLWFKNITVSKVTEDTIYLMLVSEISELRIRDKYMPIINEALVMIFGKDYNVEITNKQSLAKSKKKPSAETSPYNSGGIYDESLLKNDSVFEEEVLYNSKEGNTGDSRFNFRLDYRFDNFVVGNSNRFTYTACTAVAKNPATMYNPLFIHGPSGLGKTHLLYAITNEYTKVNKNVKVIYVKGEEFTNQLINAIAEKRTEDMREKYRTVDILLVDDIQFIAGKTSTQEEFFHTFNALYESNKQIILTSDRPPKDIKTLEERLISRFEWGLIADIQPPDLELRIAILKRKADDMGIKVANEVLMFLAENIKSNIRQIEGAIKKLSAYSYINDSVITLDLAKASIVDILAGTEPTNVTVDKVFKIVSDRYNISAEELKGRKRTKDIAFARHVCIYIIRQITDLSLPAIGKIFDRDHSTVISAIDSVNHEYSESAVFKNQLDELIKLSKL